MNIKHHTVTARLLAATAFCSIIAVSPAYAATAPETAPTVPAAASEGDQLGDIVVTAEKRPQTAQRTPISISVLSGADLANRHVVSLADLTDGSIPSLKVAPFYSRNSALIVNIRGVGVLSDGNQPARDQGVGVYVNGVYLGRAQGLGTALFDIDSLEVLKGPQGTLFGRNTEGGAINITTKKPTGEFHANLIAGAGNFGSYKAEGHIDLPSVAGIALKIDGVVSHRDPLVKNTLTGASGFNAYDKRGVRVEALWNPTSDFSADYAFDTSYDASTSLYLQLLAPGSNKQAPLGTVQATRADVANVGVPEQPSVGKVHGHELTLEYKPSNTLTLKSITSYRSLTQSQYDNGSAATTLSNGTGVFTSKDASGATVPLLFARYSLAQFRQNQISQEFQAIGELPRLKYVFGALYYQERVQDNAQAFFTNQCTDTTCTNYIILPQNFRTDVVNWASLPQSYDSQRIDRASHVTTTSVGAFGQATYTPALLDDAIHVTGGLRWTRDAKHGQLFTVNGATPVVFGVSGTRYLDAHWSRVDPMVNVLVDVSRDIHVYGKWSTGYKSGGANSRSLQYLAFNPETVSVFEAGLKTEFFNRHARFNVSAYAGTYKNVQVDFSGLYETIVGGVLTRSNRTTTETLNAPGTGGIHGVEADFKLTPVPHLTLGASYAYTYVRIPSTANPFPATAGGTVNNTPVPIYQTYTPKHGASGTIDYEVPLQGATVRAHLDGNYDSGFYANGNDVLYLGAGNPGNVYQPKGDSAFIVNGTLALADIDMGRGDARVTVSVWARNLFNEQHVFYRALSLTSGYNGFFNEARTFGGQVQVKF
ncbi:iron complex outermembrane receptor protein [Sphingomonas sp. BE270]|jgi:iron complex outermembrane receptor protein|nr:MULTISPECIES: TonB-dependent receptor [unclassified Sphingomonas]MDR6850218.1 iron complex outermembrane receptor protein [Sphingomonas sp. BE137]MDR7257152.1 iron complex outermembrane receptor protein [Sphingomonas sp. BE270]